MTKNESTYIIRCVQEPARELLVRFRDPDTIRENIRRLMATTPQNGILAMDSDPDAIEIEHHGRSVDPDLPAKDQNIPEYGLLQLRDLTTSVQLNIYFKPDGKNTMMQSVRVHPCRALGDALQDFMTSVIPMYKFYGRRMKKCRLLHAGRALDQTHSLHDQSIATDIDITLEPKIWFEWPPGLFWPPGPFTTYVLGILAVLLLAAGIVWVLNRPGPITRFQANITCTDPCRVVINDSAAVRIDSVYTMVFDTGSYLFRIYPMRFPMYEQRVGIAAVPAGGDSVMTILIDPPAQFPAMESIDVVVSGFFADDGSRVDSTTAVLINGFAHGVDQFSEVTQALPRGLYEIRYDMPNSCLQEVIVNGIRYSSPDCKFDLGNSRVIGRANILFRFKKGQ